LPCPSVSDGHPRAVDLLRAVLARERLASTAIGAGVACAHAAVDFVERPLVAFARLERPLDLGAPDDQPTDLIFLLVGRPGQERDHLLALAQVARLLEQDDAPDFLREAADPAQVLEAIREVEERLAAPAPPPPPCTPRDGIEERSGRLAGGLLGDLARRWPHYGGDYAEGLNLTALSATIFLFFACFTGAVTFGALTAAETGGEIGTLEMIVATALCGVVYAVTSGQPLIVLGGTGPILIFTTLLYRACESLELPFLPAYGWVGLWAAGFTVLLAVTDASVLLRYLTRFTDEIFVLLMAGIFIDEAIRKLVDEFQHAAYASALSSLNLALGTLGIALVLRYVRRGSLLRPWARNFLADFGTVIAIGTMTLVAFTIRPAASLPHITVPDHAGLDILPSAVALGDLPTWAIFAAALPALLLAILIFLTQQITARVVNAPEFNLTKGPAYHWDLGLIGALMAICSVFGLPWLVAATVRSLNHVSALSTTHVEDRPGGTEVRTDRVRENRVSGVAIHVLIGASLLFVPVLHEIPMACLYGVFLYMGVVSFSGNQFFERLTLWLQDPALYPRSHYLRRVPTPVVHAYTAIQALCLAILWLVKVSALAILFPLFLAFLVPIRNFLARFFDDEHLAVLDAEETPSEEAERELE